MKITGELLKSERLKKDLSIQDIAYALKLSSRIIQAIENGDVDDLPAKTFVRGFVKSYADYLKMDSTIVLKQFQEEMGTTHPVAKVINDPNETKSESPSEKVSAAIETLHGHKIESGLTQKNIVYFAVVTALIAIIVVVNKVANHYQNEIPQNAETLLEGEPVNPEALVADSPAAVATETVPQPLDVAVTEVTAVSQAAVAVATTTATAASAAAATVADAKNPDLTNSPAAEKSKGQSVEVLIEAKKDSYIDYAKGNTSEFKRINLKANTYQILKSAAGLHLRTIDGSAVSITVNGISKGPMSKSNKFVEMTF